MFQFKNKTIIIISPQKWGKMHISKHHYAIESAKKGNLVYFLNPPQKEIKFKTEIKKTEYTNLFLVNYHYFFLYYARFHWRKLFDFCFKIKIKHILKKLPQKIDIIWNFETNLFSNLDIFKSEITIYHPVDNISGINQKLLIKNSDFIFSLSDVIIHDLQKISDKKMFFINHGLSDYFITGKKISVLKNTKKTAYFVGNILLSSLDRNITKQIISENPNISFVFVGSYNNKTNNLGKTNETDALCFVDFLKKSDNVILKGMIHPKYIPEELQNADVLLVLIDPQKDINKGSNSHKILEYLSTGKVIVANHISTYADKPCLIEMVDEMHNDKLPALFKKVINNLDYYNSPELQKKRIEFALDNTYAKQIERIEKIISENRHKE